MTYTFTCDQGHEPQVFTVDAENDDEAVEKIAEATKTHVGESHPEMASVSPEEAMNMIRNKMVKAE